MRKGLKVIINTLCWSTKAITVSKSPWRSWFSDKIFFDFSNQSISAWTASLNWPENKRASSSFLCLYKNKINKKKEKEIIHNNTEKLEKNQKAGNLIVHQKIWNYGKYSFEGNLLAPFIMRNNERVFHPA